MIAIICAFFAFPLFAQSSLVQDTDADIWLGKMAQARQNVNFSMSFIVTKAGADPQPYIWRHGRHLSGITMEQLDQQNGPGREVIRVGGKVSYYESHRPAYSLASGYIQGPLPHILLDDPLSLADAYEFVAVGKSRIAGRVAQQIRIVSKDKSRFAYSVWLDQKSYLPLKINVVDLNGQKIEQMQVTNLSVTEAPDPFFDALDASSLPDVVRIIPPPKQPALWALDYVPQGMKQVKHSVRNLPNNGGLLEYVMLSDGLVDVSVYMQQASTSSPSNDIAVRFGSDIYFSRQQGNTLVTVIGKIPANTANEIASSVVRYQ